MNELRIATRRSDLALAQSRLVASLLTRQVPNVSVRMIEISSTGDVDRVSPVTKLSEVGAFVRSVQEAVIDERADMAVHSCKDLPVSGPDGLHQWFPEREVPWDVMSGGTVEDLPHAARVGTGSPRRASQLKTLRPDLDIVPIRGNVTTRLGKVGHEVDAVVLAEAGLRRTDLDHRIDHRFTLEEMVPAPGQAALCVEAIAGSRVAGLLDSIDHAATRAAVEAERQLLARTGAGCRAALGALVTVQGGGFTMHGFVEDDAGRRRGTVRAQSTPSLVAAMMEELAL